MKNKKVLNRLILPILLLAVLPLRAQGDTQGELPEPLTLDYALSLADEAHPVLEMQRSRLDQRLSQQQMVAAESDWNLGLEASLRAVHPSYKSLTSTNNDSSLRLLMRKRLYDFGRSDAQQQAADAAYRGSEWSYLDARQQRRLAILGNYLDVLLADLQYIRDNESMTMGFLHWDKAKQRSEMGQLSDIEVLELESIFQQRRREWQQSQNLQRASRLKLAISLNRPTQLSNTLADPGLKLDRELPEVNQLTEEALNSNPRLQALRQQVEAAQAQVAAAKASDGPTVHGELEAAVYNRTTSTRDPLAATLLLEVPLFGGTGDAEVARQRALLREQQAELASAELDIRQGILDLWLEIRTLKIQQEEMEALGAYRDLYIDRSRALYELEVKSDLGDAETQISDYRMKKAATDYDLALAWARLDALRGQLIKPEETADEEKQQ